MKIFKTERGEEVSPGIILIPGFSMNINYLQYPESFPQIKLTGSWTATLANSSSLPSIELYLGNDIS